jgi:Icc-related predicted phosphoesterase
MPIKALAVSDQIDPRIHSSTLRERMSDVSIVFGCGDVPARYLEFLADALNKPVYYVFGNHLEELTRRGERGKPYEPMGAINLGGRVVRDEFSGMILAGVPGSPRYTDGEEQQYTESQIAWMLLKMTPRLLWNRLRHGRALDILITHSPPRDVNDREDPPHRGFKSLRNFLKRYHPVYQLHGHVHLYDRSVPSEVDFERTRVINVYPYKLIEFETGEDGRVRPPGHLSPS